MSVCISGRSLALPPRAGGRGPASTWTVPLLAAGHYPAAVSGTTRNEISRSASSLMAMGARETVPAVATQVVYLIIAAIHIFARETPATEAEENYWE